MKIRFHTYDLKLTDPFTISRGTVTVQPTLILEIEHEGVVGFGEATSNAYYNATLDSMRETIERISPKLCNLSLENPAEIWKELDPELSQCRFAQCALDCALWDIYAKLKGQPLWRLWGFHQSDYEAASTSTLSTACPPTCFTIGLDTPEVMAEKLRAQPNWPVYKIKLDQSGSIDIIRRLRQETDAVFRVDANCAWQADQVLELADQLCELNVELIEQPLAANQYDAMADLKGRCAIPLMADESCQVEADVDKCLDSFDAINVKLVKCGGITPARRMLTRATQRGLKVMVGCMTESSIGIAAGAHLLPLLDYADLDGAMLLSDDIAEGLTWRNGYCSPPSGTGLGVRLKQPPN